MLNPEVQIKSNARLHLSLFSMHDTGLRINGGIGFAIESPSIIIKANTSEQFTIDDRREFGLTNGAKEILIQSLEKAHDSYTLNHKVSIEISGDAVAHHGFGSGTAIRLSCLEALMILNNVELTNSELIRLSGRGGTSGIGVNTYFSGGVILDLGVKNTNSTHKPSSISKNSLSPFMLQQADMPIWDIGICIPKKIKPLTHEQEIEFFNKTCPISESEAHKALYHSVMGVFASICENDKEGFEYSIRELQECEWKKAERNYHRDTLYDIENILYDAGATTVGMSSLGPSLYFLAADIDEVIELAKERLDDCSFLKTKSSNKGRKINV